jgi:cytochrome d ubiquinol oxidase subunit II
VTLPAVIAGILWLSLTAYAVLAGADFGGGVWDLVASGRRAARQREAIARAMGPVWEANHVWLILMVTGLFTAFPRAFGVLATALYGPFTLALMGVVLRGAAFAFRAHGRQAVGPISPWGVVFGVASLVAPAALGAAAAAVASGAIRAPGGTLRSGFGAGWTTALALDVALLGIALCAYLAATYLLVETETEPDLQADFRRRAAWAALVSGVLAVAGLVLAAHQAPRLWEGLTGRGLPLLVLALINGPLALWAVLRRHPRWARMAVVAQVVFVLWAWALAQWPYLVPPDLTISGSAAPASTLTALLVTLLAGGVVLVPSLWILLRVFKGRNPAVEEGPPAQ